MVDLLMVVSEKSCTMSNVGQRSHSWVHRATQMHFYDAYAKIILMLDLNWVV